MRHLFTGNALVSFFDFCIILLYIALKERYSSIFDEYDVCSCLQFKLAWYVRILRVSLIDCWRLPTVLKKLNLHKKQILDGRLIVMCIIIIHYGCFFSFCVRNFQNFTERFLPRNFGNPKARVLESVVVSLYCVMYYSICRIKVTLVLHNFFGGLPAKIKMVVL